MKNSTRWFCFWVGDPNYVAYFLTARMKKDLPPEDLCLIRLTSRSGLVKNGDGDASSSFWKNKKARCIQ
jgi:hypothetical protein